MIRNCLEKELFCMYGTFYLVSQQKPGHQCTGWFFDLFFTYCSHYMALLLFIMTRLCDGAQTKTGNIPIFMNMVLLYLVQTTNTQNNKLCLRQPTRYFYLQLKVELYYYRNMVQVIYSLDSHQAAKSM